MRYPSAFSGLLVAGIAASCCLADDPGPEKDDPWASFNLLEVKVGDIRLRYDKSMAAEIDAVRGDIETYLRLEAGGILKVGWVRREADPILNSINEVLGIKADAAVKAKQRERLDGFLAMTENLRLAEALRGGQILLLPRDGIKTFLREGGSLPGFKYDGAADKVRYLFAFGTRQGAPVLGPGNRRRELVLPVDPAAAREEVREIVGIMEEGWRTLSTGLVLHEAIEGAMIFDRMPRQDPHSRWFTDGMANAIVFHLLKTLRNQEEADEFAALCDPKQHAKLRREVNLRYWLAPAMEIDVPVAVRDREEAVQQARYSFATSEAAGLIDRHGIEVVAKILDKFQGTKGACPDLIAAIKDVTGEDMAARLAEYQSFGTPAAGIRRYERVAEEAAARGDNMAALSAALRLCELRPLKDKNDCFLAALSLFDLGQKEAADQAILKFIARFDDPERRLVWHKTFVVFAACRGDLRRAAPSAKAVLAKYPEHVPSLVVALYFMASEGDDEQAAVAARRIVTIALRRAEGKGQ